MATYLGLNSAICWLSRSILLPATKASICKLYRFATISVLTPIEPVEPKRTIDAIDYKARKIISIITDPKRYPSSLSSTPP